MKQNQTSKSELPWFENQAFWTLFESALFPPEQWERAGEEIDAALSLLGVGEEADVLDLCCGPGRHSIELARRGLHVTAVDLTERFVDAARRRARDADVEVEFVREDMRLFIRPDAFDVCVNLFTSFGYFEDPADDLHVLQNIHQSLRPGGQVLFEMMGKEVLAARFRPRDWHQLDDETMMLQERRLDHHWSWIENNWTLIHAGEPAQSFSFSHRLYSAAELERACRAAGFAEFAAFGSLDGRPYDHEAQRLVALAAKEG